MTVYCEACGNVHGDTRKLEPWKWVCVMAPAEPGYRFVSQTYSPSPPYHRCSVVNSDGECEMFEPVRVVEKADG